ncbi:hypothetical protein V5740_01500 [Croceibacterium sp. TMG7-5b_MA50]|uniref:hypothetical protein n=1 Tax=Croceibacterium sp. TMG7-5b_MA50 TaxID=3121290 RepID=UPI00322156BA
MPDAAFYREQAAKAQVEADAATLDNVRDRALRSVTAFQAMATSAQLVADQRERRRLMSGIAPD